jgi:serine/threonine protein kinase
MHSPHDDRNARAAERIGTVLKGKYRVDRVLGSGGMATVYAVTHRNEKRLAVKMLHPEISNRSDLQERFLREGYLANSVKHPGTVAVLDDDTTDDGAAFLVMELLEGGGVEEIWEANARSLPPRAVLALAHQVLDVLAAAHARGIVHRDIKPANLFLTNERKVKVLDFGIARLREPSFDSQNPTHTGMLLGTPAFMAPEQAMAESREIDAQSDLWAVGATLFTLLTGELVHTAANAQQLMVRAATSKARSLATVAPSTAESIVLLVDRALAFEKKDRWPDASAMRDAVRDAYLAAFGEVLSDAPLLQLAAGSSTMPRASAHADTLPSNPTPERWVAPATSSPAVSRSVPADLLTSTSHPVSTDAPSPPRTRRWPFAAAAGIVVLVGAGALALRSSPPAAVASSAPASASAPPSAELARAPVASTPSSPSAPPSTAAPPAASAPHRPPTIRSVRPSTSTTPPPQPTPQPQPVDPGSVR